MSTLRAIGAILRADLLQRLRTPRYWILIIALGAFMWWCLPPVTADYLTVGIGNLRGRYSSAWVGMAMALIYSPLLTLAGFYMVRGTVTRDLDTRTWQLLVATTMSRRAYLIAKWLSHLTVFGVVLAVGLAVALALQLIRGEDMHVDLVELVKPAVLITMPSLALTAAFAVWFDLVPWLRRSAGNVIFFFVFTALVSIGVSQATRVPGAPPPFPGDSQGLVAAEYDITQNWPAARAQLEAQWARERAAVAKLRGEEAKFAQEHEMTSGLSVGKQPLEGARPTLADWTQWNVDGAMLAARLFWLGLGFVLLLAATPFLDRFAARTTKTKAGNGDGATLRWLDWLLRPLQRGTRGALLAAEMRLVLRSRRWWWWLAMAVTFITQLATSDNGLVVAILAGWVLCLDVFSRLILREHATRTAALVFTAPGMRARLLGTRLVMAVGLAWTVTLPALLRLSATHPTAAVATLVAGASVALWGLALGAVFRNARPFELTLLTAAYISAQGAWVLNTVSAPATTLVWHAAALPLALGVLVMAWRQGVAVRA